MKISLAPMEGLTGYVYRNAHKECFNSIDRYIAPFISASPSGSIKSREFNDILPENNIGLELLPQVMANDAKNFLLTCKTIGKLGYNEVNLNLGCPFKLLVTKNKGSGFLAKPKELDEFLYEIFAKTEIKISIKTRLGINEPDEFYEIIELYNKYPIEELTIHPRIQKDFYRNTPNMRVFKDALRLSKNPICYNGDLFTAEDYHQFESEFPQVHSIMFGRGILANPGLINEIIRQKKTDKLLMKDFHDKIYQGYKVTLGRDLSVVNKMKGLWMYMVSVFPDNELHAERIRMAVNLQEYDEAVTSLFRKRNLMEDYKENLKFIK